MTTFHSPREMPALRSEASARRRTVATVLAALLTVGFFGEIIGVATSGASTTQKHSGSVVVLYAGSFLNLMQRQLEPAFHRATGYTVVGISNGSTALVNEIKGGTEIGDVFISASPTVNANLQGSANGSWVSSYDEFGQSPLVLGYNPTSKFAKALKHDPWYNVVDRSGFLLGRTDPATDPKGGLAVDALTGVALSYDVPALAPLASSTSNIFSETSLVGELQAAQLDAGFFYAVEAAAAHIATVPLTGTHLDAKYTIAILKNAPHLAAAKAFVAFLLSTSGQKILKANGVTPIRPAKVLQAPVAATTTTTTTTTHP